MDSSRLLKNASATSALALLVLALVLLSSSTANAQICRQLTKATADYTPAKGVAIYTPLPTTAYTLTMRIRPGTTASKDTTNIFHRGSTSDERRPSIDLIARTTNLLSIKSTSTASASLGCDLKQPLPTGVYTHLAVIHSSSTGSLEVYLNGALVCSVPAGTPQASSGPFYMSNPWIPVAPGVVVKGVRWYEKAITATELTRDRQYPDLDCASFYTTTKP